VLAEAKDRDRVGLVDPPAFGSPVRLVWVKRRWRCRELLCGRGSWTEERLDIAAPWQRLAAAQQPHQRTRRPAEAHLRTANEVPDHPGR
jgi:hypothetical protein